ncbi:hypothetical protein [Cystobacter ferrugineus]|uniref:HTTM domain-containing protein n=1 Tax=Cystobacter ferrugineus TaxID=83449 RepID=A0A1L9B1A0_9BACT|nr:hypothetical protein [Cystobacter ferrugineus]OJH35933.1 hypothetical protein BON30_35560 [Cystobacter ferrugineus]
MHGLSIVAVCLALACGWSAGLVLLDARTLRSDGARRYRPGWGVVTATQLDSRRRWAGLGVLGAAGLLASAPFLGGTMAVGTALLSCGVLLAWMVIDRRLHPARYTSVCMALLALGLVFALAERARAPEPWFLEGFASFFASHLYLVAGIRKLRSAQFMSGRVIVDGLAFGAYQAAAGNREFLGGVSLSRLAGWLSQDVVLAGGRLAALLTAVMELALGLGALGLLPVPLTLSLALVLHLSFLLISPRRIVPFTAAALGLLLLATRSPLLGLLGSTRV